MHRGCWGIRPIGTRSPQILRHNTDIFIHDASIQYNAIPQGGLILEIKIVERKARPWAAMEQLMRYASNNPTL
jgi:hypothetical protein